MAIRKHGEVVPAEALSPEAHRAISSELHKLGKVSAQHLSDEERKNVLGVDKASKS